MTQLKSHSWKVAEPWVHKIPMYIIDNICGNTEMSMTINIIEFQGVKAIDKINQY